MLSSIIVVKRRSHPVLKPLHPGPKLATTTLARLKRNALVIASVLVAPLVSPATGHAITADEVLIVVNDRSAISQQIGERYRTVRGVPASQVVRIHTEATEEIDRSTFGAEIAQPIAAHLLNHRLQDRILAIVLTKGVPLKIRGTEGRQGTQASVDSELTLLYRVLVQGAADAEGRVANPYFRPGLPAPFTRATSDIYLVTRLDGYTLEDVLELIERAGKPVKRGKVILEGKSAHFWSGSAPGNTWLKEASRRLENSGLQVVLTGSGGGVNGEKEVIGYAGWGSNDPATKTRSPGFQWVPGAIASWFVSTSARTFTRPPAGWNIGPFGDPKTYHATSPQSLIGDLIAEGVTGVVGFVYEPFLDGTARPEVLFPAYRAGFTLAESFYMALPHLSWQAVVIGDPLTAPFGPVADRPAPVSRIPFFLARRVRVLESMESTPEMVRMLAVTYAEQAIDKAERRYLDEALALANRATTLRPHEPLVLYALGTVHEARGEHAQAEETFRRLIRLDPKSPYAQQAARRLKHASN